MKKLFFLSVTVCSFLFADSDCNVFADVLQTRNPGSEILVNSGQVGYIENTDDCNLNTSYVYRNMWGHGLVCDINGNGNKDWNEEMAQETGDYGKSLSLNYSFTIEHSSALQSPVSSSDDVTISDEDEILNNDQYNTVSQDWHKYSFSWSPGGSDIGVNNFNSILHNVTISNVDGKNLKIGEFVTGTYDTTNLTINGIPNNIEIYTLKSQGSNKFTTELNASNKIDINTLSITRGSEVTLKAPRVTIENLIQSNSGSGNSVIKIYADDIDINTISLQQDAILHIYPYTPDKNVTFHSNSIASSSSSTMVISQGTYYTNSFSIPGTSNSSSIRALNNDQIINFYINGDFHPGNDPGINSDGNNGNFGALDPAKFRMFINGDLNTGGGGTTFNALVYVEGSSSLGSPTYIKGALSSGNTITVSQNSKFYWSDTINSSGFGACSNESGGDAFGIFNVVETSFNSITDPLDENSSLNQIYTKIVNKPFNIKIVKLNNDNETLENYTGIVKLEAIENNGNCATAPALWSRYVGLLNDSEKVVTGVNLNQSIPNTKFRVKYLDSEFPESCVELLETPTMSNFTSCITEMGNNFFNITQCMTSCALSNFPNISFDVSEKMQCVFSCLFGNAESVCSRDNFAVRPDHFNIVVTSPQPVRAGNDFNVTLTALDYQNNKVTNYNENVTIEGDSPFLEYGDLNPVAAKGDLSFVNSHTFVNGEADLTLKYSEVGELNLTVKEENNTDEFASVDENDADINNSALLIQPASTLIQFIPDHFKISADYKDFNNSDFTYISGDLNMSSLLDINITAENEQNQTTGNYTNGLYAKDVLVKISHSAVDESIFPFIKLYYRNYNNNILEDVNSSNNIELVYDKHNFNGGTANLEMKINFDKNYRNPVNPFDFQIKNVRVLEPVYGVESNVSVDKNATFIYGRIEVQNSSTYGTNLNTKLKYEYWDNKWKLNSEHNASMGMGRVDLDKSYKPAVTLTSDGNIVGGVETITVSTTHKLPYSAKIHLSIPQWLWFHPLARDYADPSTLNRDCLAHPCLKAGFSENSAGWGGSSAIEAEEFNASNRTSHTESNNSNTPKGINRINW